MAKKKTRRIFTDEQKRQAVDDYVSGRRSCAEVAAELGVAQGLVYKWKAAFDEEARDARLSELEGEGHSRAQARKIQQLEDELAAYQKKVAEQAVIIDLLKKLQTSKSFQHESELSGLIGTMKKSDRKKGPVK